MTDQKAPGSAVHGAGLAKRVVRVPPTSYQPSKAELEEDMSVDATPEELARCLGRTVAVTDGD
ncbi:MAG: hypothetical protein OXI20_14590 [Rhodospirillales bacterium]|nr:hypothetical protein [Rhodospirillales bacterium]